VLRHTRPFLFLSESGHPARLSAQREQPFDNEDSVVRLSGLRPLADRMSALLQELASQLSGPTAKLFSPTEELRVALVIYTKPGCPYCQQARDYYNSKGRTFIDHDAQTNRELRAEMLKFSGGDPTVPCIVKDGKYVQSGWGDPLRG
jgi:glutaredoxin